MAPHFYNDNSNDRIRIVNAPDGTLLIETGGGHKTIAADHSNRALASGHGNHRCRFYHLFRLNASDFV